MPVSKANRVELPSSAKARKLPAGAGKGGGGSGGELRRGGVVWQLHPGPASLYQTSESCRAMAGSGRLSQSDGVSHTGHIPVEGSAVTGAPQRGRLAVQCPLSQKLKLGLCF